MSRIFPYVFSGRMLVIAITLFGAVAHGYYSNRWHRSDEQRERAGQILESFRQDFGDWTMQSDVPFENNEESILLFSGAINRTYVNRVTGDLVSVAVIVGPPGQTSTHTAALCYGSRGYDSSSAIERVEVGVGGKKHEIARTKLRPESPGPRPLEVCYAWRQGDRWLVPTVPRAAFGGGEYLFKFQIAASLAENGDAAAKSIGLKFLDQFLPALEQHVFSRLSEQHQMASKSFGKTAKR